MRTPMPILEQIDALRAYLRTLAADCNRASREVNDTYRRRRISPFVESLRYRRLTQSWELRDVAEECLSQLRHARALSIAEWKPGDLLAVETTVSGYPPNPRRVVVTDVAWSRPDSYHYLVWQVTNAGRLYERGGDHYLFPSNRIRIVSRHDLLPDETRRVCESYRCQAEQFLEDVRDRGKLDDIIKCVQKQRARGYY